MNRMILLTAKREIQFNNQKAHPNQPILCTSPQRGHKGDIMGTYMTFTGNDGDIHTINFSDPADKVRHDHMVALVTQMHDLNKKLQDAQPAIRSPMKNPQPPKPPFPSFPGSFFLYRFLVRDPGNTWYCG